MNALPQIADQLAASFVVPDTSDPQSLAELHAQIGSLQALVGQSPEEGQTSAMSAAAKQAEKLVEQLILREVADTGKALADLGRALAELQALAGGASAPGEDTPNTAALTTPVIAPAEPASAAPASPLPAPASPTSAAGASTTVAKGPIALNPDDLPLVAEFVTEARGHIESAETAILAVEEHPDDLEAVNTIFRSFHTVKGVAGFLNLTQIGALAHAAENLLDLRRKGEIRLGSAAIDVILESIDLLKAMINDLEEAMKTGRPTADQPALARVLEHLAACIAGEAAGKARRAASPSTAQASTETPADKSTGAREAPADATVKVTTQRLDSLIDTVGELVIAESMVRQDVKQAMGTDLRLARNISHLGKIARSLQELSMSMRMVPIQGVFQKMARLVRDLGRKACKDVELVQSGGETELDRNVVESIGDPLVHMIRNAVDHGIEAPDQRQAAGKPSVGRIELRACHQAGNIVIQVSDDGRGLNRQKIVQKAVAAGLVRQDQELSDAEAFDLIFAPGLSTADKVTDISGRGVGMDVVKRNIESLRGRVDIASTPSRGSTFTIRLPLTLAVIDGLIVQVGPQRYILPLTSTEQSLRPTAQQISTVHGRGEMINVRGALLPLFRLHRLFNVVPRTEDPTQVLVVVVQDNQRRCGLLVDDLLGQQQVVIKSLGDAVGKTKGVSGGAILGDGNVSLILDVPGLVQAATHTSAAHKENTHG